MLTLDNLTQYSANIQAAIPEIKRGEVVVTPEELVKFLNDHTEDQNTLMIALAPQHKLVGDTDAVRWANVTAFYFLEKTDYSAHDHQGFLSIFSRTQIVAKKFVEKLISDKQDNTGLFCGFLAWLNESSISVDPVKMNSGCNGWIVEIEFNSQF
jgi:hypothetical protein